MVLQGTPDALRFFEELRKQGDLRIAASGAVVEAKLFRHDGETLVSLDRELAWALHALHTALATEQAHAIGDQETAR